RPTARLRRRADRSAGWIEKGGRLAAFFWFGVRWERTDQRSVPTGMRAYRPTSGRRKRCRRAERWSAALQSPQGQPTNGRLYQTPCAAIRIRDGGVPTNVAADGNRDASRCGRADQRSAAVQSPQEQPTNGRLYRTPRAAIRTPNAGRCRPTSRRKEI